LHLGFPHPDFLTHILTPEQVDEWWAYYVTEPFGDDWERTAMLCAITANTSGATRKSLKVKDFMPTFNLGTEQPAKKRRGLSGQQALDALKTRFGNNQK